MRQLVKAKDHYIIKCKQLLLFFFFFFCTIQINESWLGLNPFLIFIVALFMILAFSSPYHVMFNINLHLLYVVIVVCKLYFIPIFFFQNWECNLLNSFITSLHLIPLCYGKFTTSHGLMFYPQYEQQFTPVGLSQQCTERLWNVIMARLSDPAASVTHQTCLSVIRILR